MKIVAILQTVESLDLSLVARKSLEDYKVHLSEWPQRLPAHVTVSSLILDCAREEVLLGWHPQFNTWSWIGGHLEDGEEPKAGVLREIKEETGLKEVILCKQIKSFRPLWVGPYVKRGVYKPAHIHLSLGYLAFAKKSEAILQSAEHEKLAWHKLEDLESLSKEVHMIKIYQEILQGQNLKDLPKR